MSGRHVSFAIAIALPWLTGPEAFGSLPPRNVFFFIGDGMGFGHVEAANRYNGGPLSFESLPYQGQVETAAADFFITDSAAAATALATGHKVNLAVISMAIPGDASELETLLEYSRDRGKSTALVTTTAMTHATPACFGAHEPDRANKDEIAADYLNQTRPNLLFGGGGDGLTLSAAEDAGYTTVVDAAELQALDPDSVSYVSGQFGTGHLPYEYDGLGLLPHLTDMTAMALDILEEDPDGFFLMVEGGRIDHAAHDNDIRRTIHETLEFADAVQLAMDWAVGRTDTLIIVTADHETGGLTVEAGDDPDGYPNVSWMWGEHTWYDVPIYAWGVNADMIAGTMDNTDLFDVVASPLPCTCGDIDTNGAPVDLNDFATFALCLGLSGAAPPDCDEQAVVCSDLDGNGAVELGDFATFAVWFGMQSPQYPPDCIR
ncbi:MAG: alkaline phosphatase [Phycisphaerales bacterium]|nr:MAG: alkaline phosphatase [Phycisphaerales bacterium]